MQNNQYWLDHWKCDKIKFNQDETNRLLVKFYNQFIIDYPIKVFVPLCGKSLDMLWFTERGHQVIGVELSEIACESFFHEHDLSYKKEELDNFTCYYNKNIKLLAGDFFQLTPRHIGEIDFVYDRAALVALPYETRLKYAQQMNELTNKNTEIFLISGAYEQSQMTGPPFSVPAEEIQLLYGEFFDISILVQAKNNNIPKHLIEKGLIDSDILVLKLIKKS